LSWFLSWNCPNSRFLVLCLAYQAFSVHIFLLHLFWCKLGLLWFCCWSLWLCYFWGIIVFFSTILQILFSHYQTILGLVLYSLSCLPICSHLLLMLVLLTSLCLSVCICLRLPLWSARILVILTMLLSHSFFWNLSWFLFVVNTTHVSFDRYSI